MDNTFVPVKTYLSRVYHIDLRINGKLEQALRMRELATKATSTITDMPRPSSRNPHSTESVVARFLELEDDINEDIDTLVDVKREIMAVIEEVKCPELQTLLELRYLCFLTWGQIAKTMHYSARWVHIVHSRALDAVDMVLRERGAST